MTALTLLLLPSISASLGLFNSKATIVLRSYSDAYPDRKVYVNGANSGVDGDDSAGTDYGDGYVCSLYD